MNLFRTLTATFLALWAASAIAQESASPSAVENVIRAGANDFTQAFDTGDAKKIAAAWTESGTMVDEAGQSFKGRKAIEDEYAKLFKDHPGARIEIKIQSVEVPSPGVAIEDGAATVFTKDAPPTSSRYTAVHVQQNGKWLMATVRESHVDAPSNYGRLQALEFLVGRWQAKSDDAQVDTDIRWVANKSFLMRNYTVRRAGAIASTGVQIIGFDPLAARIRSWSFDSSGGYGAGLWTSTQDGWRIESTGILPDGTPTSSRDALVRVSGEDNTFGWRSTNRTAGGAALPDLPEIVLDRVKEK
jgi:uncharacterized protein (TIGR02246 family)